MFVLQCCHRDRSICSNRTVFREITIRQKRIFVAFRRARNKASVRGELAV